MPRNSHQEFVCLCTTLFFIIWEPHVAAHLAQMVRYSIVVGKREISHLLTGCIASISHEAILHSSNSLDSFCRSNERTKVFFDIRCVLSSKNVFISLKHLSSQNFSCSKFCVQSFDLSHWHSLSHCRL